MYREESTREHFRFQVQLTTQDIYLPTDIDGIEYHYTKVKSLSLHTERRCHLPLSKLTRPDHYTTKNENFNFHDPLLHMFFSPPHKLSLHVMPNATAYKR
jgi:hypothetical protein